MSNIRIDVENLFKVEIDKHIKEALVKSADFATTQYILLDWFIENSGYSIMEGNRGFIIFDGNSGVVSENHPTYSFALKELLRLVKLKRVEEKTLEKV